MLSEQLQRASLVVCSPDSGYPNAAAIHHCSCYVTQDFQAYKTLFLQHRACSMSIYRANNLFVEELIAMVCGLFALSLTTSRASDPTIIAGLRKDSV